MSMDVRLLPNGRELAGHFAPGRAAAAPADTRALIRARVHALELGAADQRKDEFLAMLAHELRNPLAAVRAAATILSTPGVLPAVADRARGVIDRQVETMTRLTDDLLDVARITQGKLSLRMAPVDLTEVLRRALEVVDYQVRQRDQQVSVSLPSAPWFVHGDATRLEQAFGNLLTNASKFSRKGGRMWLSAEQPPADDRAGAFRVRIRDEGTGIAADALPHIFDLFNQAGSSPHPVPGLGVGLALVRRIIELHGGHVTVQSSGVDRGSEFVVSLPPAEGSALGATRRLPQSPPPGP